MSLLKEEKLAIDKFLEVYNKRKETQQKNKEIMSKKDFNYGDLVIKKKSTNSDRLFGHSEIDSIGIIVGHYDIDGIDSNAWGTARDMYRVYWDSHSQYQGEDFKGLEKYNGECPEELKHVTWNDLFIDLRIEGDSLNETNN